MTLLEVEGLVKSFRLPGSRATKPVVDHVSFEVAAGETLALVGESGTGKSTTARLIPRLIEPDAGRVVLDGQDVLALGRREVRSIRRHVQMVFQDPYGSLDPRVPVGVSVGEPMLVHDRAPRAARRERAAELLERVGLSGRTIDRYPGELSGGQLQRVAIARALSIRPKLIICDEPVAALDVSVRAQVLNLMRDLQREFGISYLFISHDLSIVEAISDRLAVMYDGSIVEQGPVSEVFTAPAATYTRDLLAAIPKVVPRGLGDAELPHPNPSDLGGSHAH